MRDQIPLGVLSIRTKPVKSKKGKRVQRKTEQQAINPIIPVDDGSPPGVGGPIPISRSYDPLLVIPDNSFEKGMGVYDNDTPKQNISANLNFRDYGWKKGDEDVGFGIFWPGETGSSDMSDGLVGGSMPGYVGRAFTNSNGTRYKGLKGGGGQVKGEAIENFRESLKQIALSYQIPPEQKLTWDEAQSHGLYTRFCEENKYKLPMEVIMKGRKTIQVYILKQMYSSAYSEEMKNVPMWELMNDVTLVSVE
jgi:hypothetical protein